MEDFNLRTYGLLLLRLYRKEKDEVIRLIEDLDYYLEESRDKNKYLYYVCPNKFDIYLVYNREKTEWTEDKLQLIISNILKKSTYMLCYMSGYHGLMDTSFWEELKNSVKYFNDVKKYRKELKKKQSEEIEDGIIPQKSIDDILNKINEQGIESLTEEEQEILKNHKDEKN
jgi:hypothetical protein